VRSRRSSLHSEGCQGVKEPVRTGGTRAGSTGGRS
jgi:hypothetical protein